MTFLEKAKEMNIKMTESEIVDCYCPKDLELERVEDEPVCYCGTVAEECRECWNREMPNTELVKTVTLPMPPNTEPLTEKEKMIDAMSENAYNKGLNDAWELAKKIWCGKDSENEAIFGTKFVYEIYQLSPQEVVAKLNAYEEAQSKIEVGDVVIHVIGKHKVLVTKVLDNGYFEGINEYGSVYTHRAKDDWEKTGKRIDIGDLLKSIGE